MKPSSKFWDKVAEKYAPKPVADEAAYQEKLRITREHFRPDMEVLEIGCGTGSTALVHAPHVAHIRASDISPKMLEIAQRKAEAAKVDNVTFEVAAVEELSVDEESQDMVLALSLLHLLHDMEGAIAKARKWLKPGGFFVTSTVCLRDTKSIFRLIGPLGHRLGFFPHVSMLSASDVVRALEDAGFEIEHRWSPRMSVFLVARKPA